MKLLFDQNLSFRLCTSFAKEFPESSQVRLLGLEQARDRDLWEYSKQNGFIFVTQDSDFADMAALYGAPPKVIWLRCGNQSLAIYETLIRDHLTDILSFGEDPTASCLELF